MWHMWLWINITVTEFEWILFIGQGMSHMWMRRNNTVMEFKWILFIGQGMSQMWMRRNNTVVEFKWISFIGHKWVTLYCTFTTRYYTLKYSTVLGAVGILFCELLHVHWNRSYRFDFLSYAETASNTKMLTYCFMCAFPITICDSSLI